MGIFRGPPCTLVKEVQLLPGLGLFWNICHVSSKPTGQVYWQDSNHRFPCYLSSLRSIHCSLYQRFGCCHTSN